MTNQASRQRMYGSIGLARYRLIVLMFALICALTGTLIAPHIACADPGDEFQAASGSRAGSVVQTGTEVTYKVLTEPAGAENGTVQVGGQQVGSAIDASFNGAVVLPETVEHNGSRYTVVRIGARAFQYASLSSIDIPDTLLYIYEYAFYGCYDLGQVQFGQSPHLLSIERYAFAINKYREGHQDGLKELTIPASVRTIRSDAFFGQPSLTELHFAGTSMEKISDYAFARCDNLKYAEIPSLTAETNALGCRLFYHCTALETVVFLGDIASASRTIERSTRNFEGCSSLKTVIYHGKKFLPDYSSPGSTENVITFYSSDPTLYYTVTFYPTREAAESKTGALGLIRVRSDCTPSQLQPGLSAESDSSGLVYEGAVPAYPAGATGWAYEGAPDLKEPLPDSLYAYAVDSNDLSYASITPAASNFAFTGGPVNPNVRVVSAKGDVLTENTHYELQFSRLGEDGSIKIDNDLTSRGTVYVTAVGIGDYKGQTSAAEFEIADAEAGFVFEDEQGLTYMVTEPATDTVQGTAVVGDGEHRALEPAFSGSVNIPPIVNPVGSKVTYRVTGISAYAFGNATEDDSCTGLENASLPEGLTEIGDYAFSFCTSIKQVSVPSSVAQIGTRAFQNCTSLSNLTFQESSIESIGAYCFTRCSALTSLTLPSLPKPSSLGTHAFASCVRLQRVVFNGDVRISDALQFADCPRLTRVVFCKEIWKSGFGEGTTLYALVSFYNSKSAMQSGANALGQAAIRIGTNADTLATTSDKSVVLEGFGDVPTLPSGMQVWQLESGGATVEAPGRAFATVLGGKVGASYTVGSATYTITSENAVAIKKAPNAKKVTIPAGISINGRNYKVSAVKAGAFAKSGKCRTVVVKSSTITSFKNAFKKSKVNTVKVPSAKRAAYKKLLTKSKCGRKVKVK